MVTREAPLTDAAGRRAHPPRRSIAALHVFDRYDMSVVMTREMDLYSPDFQGPVMYRVTPRRGAVAVLWSTRARRAPFRWNHRRTERGGFTSYYDQDWGVSELIPIMTSLIEDQTLASSIAHLSRKRLRIPVLKIQGLAEKAAGDAGRLG